MGKLPTKKDFESVGQPEDGIWVLGPDLSMDSLVDPNQSQNIWVGHLYDGPKIAQNYTACPVELPLSTDSLKEHLRAMLKHNLFPALMVTGACAMAMHYQTILQKFLFCPVPIAFWNSVTGKTTALRCGLAMCGVYLSLLYSKASLEMYNSLCSDSHLPLGIDDTRSWAACHQ